MQAIQTSPRPPCCGRRRRIGSPPILAGGLVWSINGGTLYGLDPANGQPVQQVSVGGEANHFPTPSVGDGLLLAPSTDQVYAFTGSAGLPGPPSPAPVAPGNSSYWLVASDGGIFTFGNAGFFGSAGSLPLNKPVVGMAPTASKNGYWLVASDGGIFTYGNASFLGSKAASRSTTHRRHGGDTRRRRLLARRLRRRHLRLRGRAVLRLPGRQAAEQADRRHGRDPGRARLLAGRLGRRHLHLRRRQFHGSMGGKPLNKPIVGMAASPDGLGYWLVASDGGIFNFGDAGFYGSAGGTPLNKPAVGIAASPDGRGYWIAATDGGIFNYGDANFYGSEGGTVLNKPVVGVASAS